MTVFHETLPVSSGSEYRFALTPSNSHLQIRVRVEKTGLPSSPAFQFLIPQRLLRVHSTIPAVRISPGLVQIISRRLQNGLNRSRTDVAVLAHDQRCYA